MRGSFNKFSVLVLALSAVANAAPHGMYPTHQQRFLNSILSHKPSTEPQVKYYGGMVIANVKVYSVFWGANVDPTTTGKIGSFFSATVNSTYMDWLKEYNTNIKAVDGRQGTNQSIGRGTYAGEYTITPKNVSTTLTDANIQAEIELQIGAGALPRPDNNTLFMVYFPAGITITLDGQASCQAFCAYHESYVSQTFGNVFYGVMPDMGGACSLGCGFQPQPFDNITEVTSHELIEAITIRSRLREILRLILKRGTRRMATKSAIFARATTRSFRLPPEHSRFSRNSTIRLTAAPKVLTASNPRELHSEQRRLLTGRLFRFAVIYPAKKGNPTLKAAPACSPPPLAPWGGGALTLGEGLGAGSGVPPESSERRLAPLKLPQPVARL